jgi:hypothetical protein
MRPSAVRWITRAALRTDGTRLRQATARQALCDSWDLWVAVRPSPFHPFAGAPIRLTSSDPAADSAQTLR